MNRGKSSIEDLNEVALSKGLRRILIVGTRAGNPSFLLFYSVNPLAPSPLVQVILKGVTLRREFTKRRAPFSRIMGVTFQGDVEDLAEELSEGFNTPPPVRVKAEMVGSLADEFDVVLHLRKSDDLVHATFYYVNPFHEIGPRMRIKGYKVFRVEDHP